MGKVKQLLQDDLARGLINTPSHLDQEMHRELIKLNKTITTIKKILEECK